MDIGKYIGKFLLKHKYCSLPGLGVFDLKKLNSQINASSSEVSAPKYAITFNPVGSIDDMFASFIANFENVSISNASNNIKEYCIMVKEEVAKTGRYEIENLGKLTMSGNKMVFQQASDLDLGFEPAPLAPLEIKPLNSVDENGVIKKDDYSYPPANVGYRNSNNNWTKVLLPVLVLAGLAVGGYFGFQYFKNNAAVKETEELTNVEMDTVKTSTPVTIPDTNSTAIASDTNNKPATTATDTNQITTQTATTPPANAGTPYQVAILSYNNEASATLKSNKLKSYGNNTSVVAKDGRYLVIATAAHPLNDTLKLTDSLRRMFNPKGPVYILK